MALVYKDSFFMLGDQVLRRKRGWPMGGPLSEPGTLVDLSEDLRLLDADSERLRDLGWHFEGKCLQDVVSGLMHVDDNIVFSAMLCRDCLAKGMQRMWPADVGIEVEGLGPTLRFLSSVVHVHGYAVSVFPHNPNLGFAVDLLQCPLQKIARLGPFISFKVSSYAHLKAFVLWQVIGFDHIVQGSLPGMCSHLCALYMEIHNLGWPRVWLSNALRSIPRRHSSHVIRACRMFGRAWKYFDVVSLTKHLQAFANMSSINVAIFEPIIGGAPLMNSASTISSSSSSSDSSETSDSTSTGIILKRP